MSASETLLVNYWYAHPVGHALEGVRYALGYKTANRRCASVLLLNGATAVELARLPDPTRYRPSAWAGLDDRQLEVIEEDEDGEGLRTPSMSIARIREDLPELLRASEMLIEKRLPYEAALARYFPRLLAGYGGDRSRAFSFDNIREWYMPAPSG